MFNFIAGLLIGAFLSSPVLALVLALVHSAIIAFEPLIHQFGQVLINA